MQCETTRNATFFSYIQEIDSETPFLMFVDNSSSASGVYWKSGTLAGWLTSSLELTDTHLTCSCARFLAVRQLELLLAPHLPTIGVVQRVVCLT